VIFVRESRNWANYCCSTGTAAVISPIAGFSYKDHYYELPKLDNSVAADLKLKLTNIQNKVAEDTFGWTVKV
jgi:branched-chain amino acid aminotransferase